MLHQSSEVIVQHRGTERWKEWIPLATQQLRLRSLIQIIAYNVTVTDKDIHCVSWKQTEKNIRSCASDVQVKHERRNRMKTSFYYTLHLTTMSAPFYTSEKLENENPKWAEIEIGDLINNVNVAVRGVVIRLWVHRESEQDQIITVWGVYFTGLSYLGPKLRVDPTVFHSNTIVFHMHGGYFTSPHSFKEAPKNCNSRFAKVKLKPLEVRQSYGVNLLLRLHTVQQVIKQQTIASQNLREKISVGGFNNSLSRESAALRKLLSKSLPKVPQRQEILKLKRQIELVKFRVTMLNQEKARKQKDISQLLKKQSSLTDKNQERGSELMSRYQNLHKDTTYLQEWKKNYIGLRESFLHCNAQLTFRRKQLISELNYIYPVAEMSNNMFTICGVLLPDSEDFYGHDDVSISVALGFAAHLVQMISIFLQVPLRYPLIHFGSRSKIIDHVAEKLPDGEREFPLYCRGKDKLQFNYGVYLLNKNIAQLRCYCGLPTQDLRATLPNLSSLLHLRIGHTITDSHQRTFSGSSQDFGSSLNVSPVGSLQSEVINKRHSLHNSSQQFEKGHRATKSMGSSDFQAQLKIFDSDSNSVKCVSRKSKQFTNGSITPNIFSLSLDKGLDEYCDARTKKVNDTSRPSSGNLLLPHHRAVGDIGHISSEPVLTPYVIGDHAAQKIDKDYVSSGDEGQKKFLQTWEACGPIPICSDDDETFRQPLRIVHSALYSDSGVECDQLSSSKQDIHKRDQNKCLNLVSKTNIKDKVPSVSHADSSTSDSMFILSHSGNYCKNCMAKVRTPESGAVPIFSTSLDSQSGADVVDSCSCFRDAHVNVMEDYSPLSPLDNMSGESNLKESKSMHFPIDQVESINHSELKKCLEELNTADSSAIIDNLFANVTSRTEALANQTSSFNLVKSRHGSMVDGPS